MDDEDGGKLSDVERCARKGKTEEVSPCPPLSEIIRSAPAGLYSSVYSRMILGH